jgi:hypothetical protein
MASITPSKAPGVYLDAQEVTFDFSPDIVSVAMTKNSAPPSITKYIAYDTLVPPNPFLAVTEDGRGRVVYDGGFPKFYNGENPSAPASFADLTSAGKYLYNALNWVAHPGKVAAGNKKVLVLGDALGYNNYAVKSTGPNGFNTSVSAICAVAGFTPTFMDLADFAVGKLDIDAVALDQYTCVILFSSAYPNEPLITTQAVNNLVLYRENGNGLVLITDHGHDLATIEDVKRTDAGGFFKTANAIAYNFGSYFTGVYDRTPVNVGFIRQNYGDHPLYAGLADTDSVPAGASESKVVATTAMPVAPGEIGPNSADVNGVNTFNFLASLSDGSTQTFRFQYSIQKDEFVFMKSVNPATNQVETNNKAYTDILGKMALDIDLDASVLGAIRGLLYKGSIQIGEVYFDNGENKIHWYSGIPEALPVANGENITVVIQTPVVKTVPVSVSRPDISATVSPSLSKAGKVKAARTTFGFAGIAGAIGKIHEAIRASLPDSLKKQKLSAAGSLAFLRDVVQSKLPLVEGLTAQIYETTAATQAALSGLVAVPGTFIIDAETGAIHMHANEAIITDSTMKASHLFAVGSVLTSTVDGAQYKVGAEAPLTKL